MNQYFLFILLLFFQNEALSHPKSNFRCDLPRWNFPPGSTHGVFKGDLLMDCWMESFEGKNGLESLKEGIIKKIQIESIVHEGPIVESKDAIRWDVSHQIEENGSTVSIRETALLGIKPKNQLYYRTFSKKISATGMAGYLRSVNFSMKVTLLDSKTFHIEFENEVTVERPWYALDLIFAPIAENICFQKMNRVKEKILPWVVNFLN